MRHLLLPALLLTLLGAACAPSGRSASTREGEATVFISRRVFGDTLAKTDDDWRRLLSPEQYHVLREKGTERPFSGQWHAHKGAGLYLCAGCGKVLFSAEAKFDSGTGWPSFYQPIHQEAVREERDVSQGVERQEVLCQGCGGHLGHVFQDGPLPTGLRYCLNSAALAFKKKE